MDFEQYRQLYIDRSEGTVLRPGKTGLRVSFAAEPQNDRQYRLFVTGDTGLFYQWKSEPESQMQYRTVCDALDTVHACGSRFCLDLSSDAPAGYDRRVYKKLMWPPNYSYLSLDPVPGDWQCGIRAKAEGLRFAPEGHLCMRLEIYLRHDGVSPHSVENEPDRTVLIDIPEGTWDWREFRESVSIPPEETAHVGVWLEGRGYSGRVYFEKPFLSTTDSRNVLPDFDMPVPGKEHYDWCAQNLSRKEWPEFSVSLNGRTVFEGAVFERCHLASEWEVALPGDLIREKNEVGIRLISGCHDPLPYTVREVGLLTQPDGVLTLVACSPAASLEEGGYLLIKTKYENASVTLASDDGAICGGTYRFTEAGLHGLRFRCLSVRNHAAFTLSCAGASVRGEIPQIVERRADHVITGTGDMVYIPQRIEDMEEYLSWYLANGIGDMVTVRPVYRWCGTRALDPQAWRYFTRLMNELGFKYVHMLDGRELPGYAANPDEEMLRGEGFLGRQGHEQDGAAFYFGTICGSDSLMKEQYGDMLQRICREDPLHSNPWGVPANFIYRGDRICLYRDPEIKRDMREAMKCSVAQLSKSTGRALRHTGPSVMFKYLSAAGYRWLGAETMYGTMEPLMAFLRGASLMNGTDSMGVHHAVQWSSSPHDSPDRIRRYRLALYVSYMQGATDINTEEGLWHLEAFYTHFSRFSGACREHLAQQRDFYRYVASHQRTGRFFTPVALLHGRYDGWHGEGRKPWGWNDCEMTDAGNSWELLRVFYPNARPGRGASLHGSCPDHEVGFHTGMPLGNIDVLPAESEEALWEHYGALAFMGYHCAEEDDFARMTAYVRGGGELLLTRAHLSDTTDYYAVAAGRLHQADGHPYAFTDGSPAYTENHINGHALPVAVNIVRPQEVWKTTDEGTPLICVYHDGDGRVILFNTPLFPAAAAIRELYGTELTAMMRRQTDRLEIWTETEDDVGSAVYRQENGSSHIYFTAVDWFRSAEPLRTARLRIRSDRYTVSMPFGVMIKCVAKDGRAAWPHSENGEVLSLSASSVRVQGTGTVTFTLAAGGTERDVTVDFGCDSIRELTF